MYQFFICFRYLKRRTAPFAIIAVTFGVATLLTVLSMMEGYVVELRAMIRDQESHLTVRSGSDRSLCDTDMIEDAIRTVPNVIATAPSIETVAMYWSDQLNPCFLRGIAPEREIGVTNVENFFYRPLELDRVLSELETEEDSSATSGDDLSDLNADRQRREKAGASAVEILREEGRTPLTTEEVDFLFSRERRKEVVERLPPALRKRLESREIPAAVVVGINFLTSRELALGQIVKILTVNNGKPLDAFFVVTGAFKTGNYEVDSRLFFIHNHRLTAYLGAFHPILGEPCFDSIRVMVRDYDKAAATRESISAALATLPPETGGPDAFVYTWEDQRRNFLQAVEIEKWIMGFVISLLNVFTACIILLMLVLLVIEKRRDAGILLSLGAAPQGVFSIFVLNGLMVTTIGTATGLGAGLLFVKNINTVHDWIYQIIGVKLFDPAVYHMDQIPIRLTASDVFISTLPAIAFGLIASLIPAAWATRKDPIKAIHHE